MAERLVVQKGDVIVRKYDDSWSVIRILDVDQFPDGIRVAHCLHYVTAKEKPDLGSARSLAVAVYHAPIDASSFESDWERIGNETPTAKEVSGFARYLKGLDFERYAELTHQDVDGIIAEANAAYQKAYECGQQKNHQEAIEHYSRAIDLFPFFYEAIDNRAFTYMDLGDYERALEGFEMSLDVNPDGFSAFFSRGECLMKLGRFEEAEDVFKEGMELFPEKKDLCDEFYKKVLWLKESKL